MTEGYDVVRCPFCSEVVTSVTIRTHKCRGVLLIDLYRHEKLVKEIRHLLLARKDNPTTCPKCGLEYEWEPNA